MLESDVIDLYGTETNVKSTSKVMKLTCFIAAPVGADTGTLRTALEQRKIKWIDATSARPKWSMLMTIESAIRSASFVCAVIPHDAEASGVYFQLGIAAGLRKPVLLLVEPGVAIIADLASLNYLRATLNDQQAIAFNLDAFLDHFAQKPEPRSTGRLPRRVEARSRQPRGDAGAEMPYKSKQLDVEWAKHAMSEIEQMTPASASRKLEELVVGLLEEARAVVRQQPGEFTQGVDMALWLDEVESGLRNPIMVEIKLGTLTEARIDEAENLLRRHVATGYAGAGLLVYLDRGGQTFARVRACWPLIFRLSIHDLVDLVGGGKLGKTLLAERNRVAHSGAV
jgi:hypothetical protein